MLSRRRMDEAVALHRAGKLAEAAEKYEALLQLNPADADLLHLTGIVAGQQGDYTRALILLRKAITLAPESPDYQNSLAITCERVGDAAQAAYAYNEQGTRLLAQHRFPEALAAYEQALRLQPDSPPYRCNKGVALLRLGRLEEAEAILSGIEDRLQLSYVPLNLGNVLTGLGKITQAIAAYDRALAIDPELVEAQWARGQAFLLTGRFAEGWAGYEWRRRWRGFHYPYPGLMPSWTGQSPAELEGMLLVVSEQGLGDCIQFARYLPKLVEAGYHVVFDVRDELYALFTQAFRFDGIEIVARGQALLPHTEAGMLLRRCKAQIPLLSLPFLAETNAATIPAPIPYLTVPAPAARNDALKIGLVRAGQATHGGDLARSIAAPVLAPLLTTPAEFMSLQVVPFEAPGVSELGLGFHDFADTAAAIAGLDLVISVDTSVAHLAGAMGKPVWILLPYAPDWRWGLGGDTTPWYPTARLFRQQRLDDWGGVIAEVGKALDGLIQENRHSGQT